MTIFLLFGVAIGSDVAVPYTVLIALMIVLVCRLDQRCDLGPGTLWGLSIWGLGHMAGGVIPSTATAPFTTRCWVSNC